MKNITALLFTLAWSVFTAHSQMPDRPNLRAGADYKPGTVIFKLLPEHRAALMEVAGQAKTYRLADATLQSLCAKQSPFAVKPLYPHHAGRKAGKVDLSLIGELQFSETTNVPAICRELMATGRFEYVEPRFLNRTGGGFLPYSSDEPAWDSKLLFMPNDPLFAQQWHLPLIHAPEAWDVEQGDTSVVIGIVDSGVDYLHPDLAGNIARNHADPVNGVDDDLGWDFEDNDNNPNPTDFHGTGAAGIAAASTNNGIGLAAPGFKCRVLAVKGFGLEGMVYAADRGCKVINNSWVGGAYASQYYIDVVNYCTFDKDALVVAGAGNDSNSVPLWPASIDHALSVAATDKNDKKEPYSNFNHLVDISAPGSILATWANGGYTSTQAGTSWSTAMVSGAAALVRAHFPNFTATQAAERLRITADDISAQNLNYVEQLGKGRLNIFRALTDPATPAVRLRDAKFSNGTGGSIISGDTVRLSGSFVNYLADATNLTVTISSPNPNVSFLKNTFSQNLLATLDTASNAANPFIFVVSPNLPFDTELQLRLGFQADGYTDWQWLTLTANPTSTVFDNGLIQTTIFSSGSIGIRRYWGDGIPISYGNSTNAIAIGALMLGANPPARVSDAALIDVNVPTFEKDFKILEAFHPVGGSGADLEFACAYNDSTAAPPTSMGLSVQQKVYGWTGDHFFITEYEVTNNSAVTRDNFRIGFWLEPDISDYRHNRAEQDSALQLGYVYALSPGNRPYYGLQLLSDPPMNLYVYEWLANYGGVNLLDNFSTAEKRTTLTTSRPAGGFGDADGEDVGMVGSTGPFQFAPGQTLKAAFAILVADSLVALRAAAMQAKMRYENLPVGAPESVSAGVTGSLKIYPNPAGDLLWVELPAPGTAACRALEVFDLSGKMVLRVAPLAENGRFSLRTGHLPAGVYLLRATTDGGAAVGRFVKN